MYTGDMRPDLAIVTYRHVAEGATVRLSITEQYRFRHAISMDLAGPVGCIGLVLVKEDSVGQIDRVHFSNPEADGR